jgi:two-component system phosphate regulon sensor histidine kinase PhoR
MYRAVLDSMFDGVAALDGSLNIIFANPRLCSLFDFAGEDGAEKKDPVGMPLMEFGRSLELEEAARQVLSSGTPAEFTVRRYVKGTEQHFRVFAAPLEEGPGVVLVLSDITRLVKLEQVRKDFASNVAHELRTPIQVVKGFAEMILDSSLDDRDETRRFTEIIGKTAKTMENITGDLLNLVNLEDNDGTRASIEETSLYPLLAEAADMVGFAARKKNIPIEIFCPRDLKAKLYGPFIIQALINLLNNAINYSEPDTCVRVFAYRENNELVLEVKDEGIGIPSEHIDRIFERFYRVDHARSRKAGGTGLGLAIVRHIALFHGGTAEAESHAGEGSVFRLRLPS